MKTIGLSTRLPVHCSGFVSIIGVMKIPARIMDVKLLEGSNLYRTYLPTTGLMTNFVKLFHDVRQYLLQSKTLIFLQKINFTRKKLRFKF